MFERIAGNFVILCNQRTPLVCSDPLIINIHHDSQELDNGFLPVDQEGELLVALRGSLTRDPKLCC